MLFRALLFAAPALLAIASAEGVAAAAEPTTAECLAASDDAIRLDREHELREERSRLIVCAADACPADVRNECLARVDQVNAELPSVVFSAKDGDGADLSAVRVTMDGQTLAERLEGTAITIDPGEHAFVFEAPGQPQVQENLVILEGEKDRRETIVFGRRAGAPKAPAGPARAPGPPPAAQGALPTQKIFALVAGGVGVVGLGVGTAFGLSAIAKRGDAQTECPNVCSSQDGVNEWSQAVSVGNAATVAFVVGGAGIVAGAVLWLTAPSASRSGGDAGGTGGRQVGLGVGVGTLRLQGSW